MTRLSRTRACLCALPLLMLASAGCIPQATAPEVTGPIDTKTASQLQASVRASQGEAYTVEHQYNGKPFTASWEVSNALKKSARLQIKPPGDWDQADVYQCLEIVLADHSTKPWYGAIDDTVLSLFRQAVKADENIAVGVAPDTPYESQVTVKHYDAEWFVEVNTKILDENGMSLGF
ncbi:MAG: hypothetical protein ACO1RT_09130 [Planctomycetaceae bacterium]